MSKACLKVIAIVLTRFLNLYHPIYTNPKFFSKVCEQVGDRFELGAFSGSILKDTVWERGSSPAFINEPEQSRGFKNRIDKTGSQL